MNTVMDILNRAFDNSEHRLTKPRKQILDVIIKNKEHMTVMDIYDSVKDKGIGLATIYRNIELFKELGIINETVVGDLNYYELKLHKCNKMDFHVHINCRNCDKIVNLKSENVKKAIDDIYFEVMKKYDFIIKDISFVFEAQCKTCNKQQITNS